MSDATILPARSAARAHRTDGLTALLRQMHLHGCELIVWTYFISVTVFKRWYIMTALVLMITALGAMLGTIRLRGVVMAMLPFALFFSYQFLGIFWSQYPSAVVFSASMLSINFFVAFLFWSLVRNHPLDDIAGLCIRTAFPAALITVHQLITMPEAARSGGYSLVFLSLVVPFAYEQLMRRHRPWRAGIALVLALAVVVVSRSRAPMAGAALAGALSFLVFGRGFWARLRIAVIAGLVLLVVLGGLLVVDTTRTMLLTTWVRLTGSEVLGGSTYIAAEREDIARRDLDVLVPQLLLGAQPLGLGLGAYQYYHERYFGYVLNLHNAYEMWALEGGIGLVAIMIWLLWRHVKTIRRSLRTPARTFALCVAISTIAVMAMAAFHRVDITFWVCLGLIAGVRQQYVRQQYLQRRRVRVAAETPA